MGMWLYSFCDILNYVFTQIFIIIHLELWQQADDGRGMTPCHEQSLMAFDVKGNSQLLAKYVMEILRERLALKKDKVTME